ncbi:MAG: peptide chain release factor 2 [Kiritimatiellae bacterium]|nr:peptide chain release factor 2 [Kiritimatiellia bacterium]
MLAPEEIYPRLVALKGDLADMKRYLGIDAHRAAIAEGEAKAADPAFWDDQRAAQETIAETNAHKSVVKPFDELSAALSDAETMRELAEAEPEGPSRDGAWRDLSEIVENACNDFEALRTRSLLTGPLDACNAFLTLHAGAGGTEACDWVSMLLRMYSRYCERAGFELEMLDQTPGDEAGLVTCTFAVRGPDAYGYLKAERGTHRLVRISPFDSNARRHTSFAALDVVAELQDETKVELKPEDLEVDTYRSGGAGGQHVNKTDSAIRIRHVPTGIVVTCDAERSQFANRKKAMAILRAKVYEYEEDKKRAALERFYGEKGSISWGNQIRSYVLQPYTMAKDLRTGHETGNVQAVLDGDLAPFIAAYLKWKSAGSPKIKGAAASG